MRFRFVVAAAVAVALSVPAIAARADVPPPVPPPPVAGFAQPAVATIAKWVKAANAGDRAGVIALFTRDSSIADEFAPFRFPAPSAAAKWYDGFVADAKANDVTHAVIAMHPPKFINVVNGHAWVVTPLVYTYLLNGAPAKETGMLVFTESKVGAAWLITSMSWAKLTDSSAP
jgi:hypothetical protein